MDIAQLARNAAALTALNDPKADPVAIADQLAQVHGERATLQIDLTDPPSPVIARIGDIEAAATTADDALRGLCSASVAVLDRQIGDLQPVSIDVNPAPIALTPSSEAL